MKQVLIKFFSICFLLFLVSSVFAHEPHDDIYEVEISPTYSKDHTLFINVRNCLFKSEDGGKNWLRLVNGLDYKGFLRAIAISPQTKDILYLSSLGDGVYRSEDAGISWIKVNNGFKALDINILLVAPYSTEVVLAADQNGRLYKTENAGKNWKEIMSNNQITAVQFLPGPKNRILAGDEKGTLYVSSDAGKSWKEIFNCEYCSAITSIAVSPRFLENQTFLIGTEKGGIFKTKDSGKSFKKLGAREGNITVRNIRDIKFLPRKYGKRYDIIASTWHSGVFRSRNNGWSWHKYSKGLTRDLQADRSDYHMLVKGSPLNRPHFSDLEVSDGFVKDKTIFLAGFNGLFKSTNGGKTWQEVDTFSRAITGISISPNYKNDSTIAVATYTEGAYISNNGGIDWRPLSRDLRYIRNMMHYFKVGSSKRRVSVRWLRLFDVMFSPDYASSKAIYFTPLAQMIKLIRCTQKNYFKTSFSDSAMAIAFSPDFANDKTIYLASQTGKIWISKNMGKNFENIGETGKHFRYTSICFVISPDFLSDKTLYYAAYDENLYKSKDGGYNWELIKKGTPFEECSDIKLAISPDYKNDKTLITGTDKGVYISENEGKNWFEPQGVLEVKEGLVEAVAVSPGYKDDKTILISIAGKGLFKSENGGKYFEHTGDDSISLSKINLPSGSMPIQFSPDYTNDKTIYGYGAAGAQIFKSTNSGKTWQTISISKPKDKFFNLITDKLTVARILIYDSHIKPIIKKVIHKFKVYKRYILFALLIFLFILGLKRIRRKK